MNKEFLKIWLKIFLRLVAMLGYLIVFTLLMSIGLYFIGMIVGLLGISYLFAWICFDAKR